MIDLYKAWHNITGCKLYRKNDVVSYIRTFSKITKFIVTLNSFTRLHSMNFIIIIYNMYLLLNIRYSMISRLICYIHFLSFNFLFHFFLFFVSNVLLYFLSITKRDKNPKKKRKETEM